MNRSSSTGGRAIVDRETSALLSLLRSGLWNRSLDDMSCFPLSVSEWENVCHSARQQTVSALVWNGLRYLPSECLPGEQLLMQWTADVGIIEARNRKMDGMVAELDGIFSSAGLHPVLQKGQGIASLYQAPLLRESGDIDWYFCSREENDKALSIVSGAGCKPEKRPDGSWYYVWKGIEVEHHLRLFDIFSPFRKSFLVHMAEAYDCSRMTFPSGNEGPLVPATMQTLLMTSAHIFKHIAGNGIGLRQFCDMACCFVSAFGKIRQEEYRDMISSAGLKKWNRVLQAFLTEYIGLERKYLPLPEEDASMNAVLLSSVIAGGNFGHYRQGRHKSAGRKLRTALMFLRNSRLTFRLAPAETLSVFFNLLSGQSDR